MSAQPCDMSKAIFSQTKLSSAVANAAVANAKKIFVFSWARLFYARLICCIDMMVLSRTYRREKNALCYTYPFTNCLLLRFPYWIDMICCSRQSEPGHLWILNFQFYPLLLKNSILQFSIFNLDRKLKFVIWIEHSTLENVISLSLTLAIENCP